MAESKRELDRQVAEKYFGMGWIQEDEGRRPLDAEDELP